MWEHLTLPQSLVVCVILIIVTVLFILSHVRD